MGIWADSVLPRVINKIMDTGPNRRLRDGLVSKATGVVVELGFGSGLNLPHYDAAKVKHIHAIDPATLGQTLAKERLADCTIPVTFSGLDGASLPFESSSIDTVLSTWTLCTIPDLEQALAEVRRVLKPGGLFLFLEHGASSDPHIATWQDRINPYWMPFSGGCHLNRNMEDRLKKAGFTFLELETFYGAGPKLASFLYQGEASAS